MSNSYRSATVGPTELAEYLEATGWKQRPAATHYWLFLSPPNLAAGIPSIEVAFPREGDEAQVASRVQEAMHAVAMVLESDIASVAQSIRDLRADRLYVRIAGDIRYSNSVPLPRAAAIVSEIQNLVTFAVMAEGEPRPYFKKRAPRGRQAAHQFLFGQTAPGSVVFMVEAPVTERMGPTAAPTLIAKDEASIRPITRRALERVMRGLAMSQDAAREHDTQAMTQQYVSGLNGNLLDSIVSLNERAETEVEYWVDWSPTLPVAQDINPFRRVTVTRNALPYLREASTRLAAFLEPFPATVYGQVVVSNFDPPGRSLFTREQYAAQLPREHRDAPEITVRYLEPSLGEIRVRVHLPYDQWAQAHDAMADEASVQIEGTLRAMGNHWRLTDVTSFSVVQSGS